MFLGRIRGEDAGAAVDATADHPMISDVMSRSGLLSERKSAQAALAGGSVLAENQAGAPAGDDGESHGGAAVKDRLPVSRIGDRLFDAGFDNA